jgi:bifunctional DNA-binding transcriptional regulator/antitoxin component of YhaV-PrlF toxin-antitoxin module
MADYLPAVELQIGPQGRVVIPASLRKAWQLKNGEVLLAHIEADRLVLERRAQVLQRVKGRFAALRPRPSLADELIADRRTAACQEDAE